MLIKGLTGLITWYFLTTQNADLTNANLEGANLEGANLKVRYQEPILVKVIGLQIFCAKKEKEKKC